MKNIIETVVYDGRLKEWRILNVNTGTVYSSKFDWQQDALNAIQSGEKRAGGVVVKISLSKICDLISNVLRFH